MSHIHGEKKAAFPRSAPVGEYCIEKVGRKIHILNHTIDSWHRRCIVGKIGMIIMLTQEKCTRGAQLAKLPEIPSSDKVPLPLAMTWSWTVDAATTQPWATISSTHWLATTSYHVHESYSRRKKGSVSPFSPCGRKLYWKGCAENSNSRYVIVLLRG